MHRVTFERMIVREVALPLRAPFLSNTTETIRRHLIVEMIGEGVSGWGECPLLSEPFYSPETPTTAWHSIERFCVPLVRAARPTAPELVGFALAKIVGHPIARAGIECAAWDLWARSQSRSLFELLGATRTSVEVGIALGVSTDIDSTLQEVAGAVRRGYRRVKLKIRPGCDREVVESVRRAFSGLRLWVDGNGHYDESALHHLLRFADQGVELIEQPFARGDVRVHRQLCGQSPMRVSLDESIESFRDIETVALTGAADSVAIKVARLGGICAALAAIECAAQYALSPWMGGLLESGIGRALNLILAGRAECVLPGDIAESARYADHDLVVEPFVLRADGEMEIPQGIGLGVEVDRGYLDHITVSRAEFDLG